MKSHFYPAKEFVFQQTDGSYYAVSLSFGLFAEGETSEEAITHLKHATIGYLMMCFQENESEEEIYRGAPQEYVKMYEEFVHEPIKPSPKSARKKFWIRSNNYEQSESLVLA